MSDDIFREIDAILKKWGALSDSARSQGRELDEIADRFDQGRQTLSAGCRLLSASTQSSGTEPSPYTKQVHVWVVSQEPLLERAAKILQANLANVTELRSHTTASVVSGTTMTSSIASSMILEGLPLKQISLPQFDRSVTQQRLDARLQQLTGDGRLADRRRGAWEAYRRGTRESRVQACHTMRDILMYLMDEHAKPTAVQAALWWRDPEARPSRRDQLRYLIIGRHEGPLEEGHLNILDQQVGDALATYDKACQIAHDRYTLSPESFWGALSSLEDSIDLLFEERERVAYLRALAK